MVTSKLGPYTEDELLAYWKTILDPRYWQTIVDRGEGNGLEVFTQQFAQFMRTSQAVDRTTQAMFILPWSGQTDVPAQGALKATVTLVFSRMDVEASFPYVLPGGVPLVEQVTTDYAPNQGITVRPGRRYFLDVQLAFGVGFTGEQSVIAISEREGYGYNDALPGTLTGFVQPGAGFTGIAASVMPGPSSHVLRSQDSPDPIISGHVGSYMRFLSGLNTGQIARIIGVLPADPSLAIPNGSAAVLDRQAIVQVTAAGVFEIGETVTGAVSLASGTVLVQSPGWLVIATVTGTFVAAELMTGAVSGATATVAAVTSSGDLIAEAGTAAWEVRDWTDLGFAVTNPASPSGGRAAFLDELGSERGIGRAAGELDDSYRLRVATLPDTVSPNALRRTANRIIAPFGASICLREVGQELFPGLFCDGNPLSTASLAGYSYDLDAIRLTGVGAGTFADGERVVQMGPGGATYGRVSSFVVTPITPPPVASPPAAATRGVVPPISIPFTLDVANVRGPGFVVGVPVIGDLSGATFVPGSVIGGLRVQDRFKLWLDYIEFRAFFLLGVPPFPLGDFGVAYDAGTHNAFDAAPFESFFDGFPVSGASLNLGVWQAIDQVRAGGVGFDVYLEPGPCV